MKKYIFLMIFCYAAVLNTQETRRPEPYVQEEFPLWSHKLRRFEVVLFGTFPITMLVSSLLLDIVENTQEGKGVLAPRKITAETIGSRALLGLSFSTALSLTDFFIEEERLSTQQQEREKLIETFENAQ